MSPRIAHSTVCVALIAAAITGVSASSASSAAADEPHVPIPSYGSNRVDMTWGKQTVRISTAGFTEDALATNWTASGKPVTGHVNLDKCELGTVHACDTNDKRWRTVAAGIGSQAADEPGIYRACGPLEQFQPKPVNDNGWICTGALELFKSN